LLFGEVQAFHRPHPSPDTDKGALALEAAASNRRLNAVVVEKLAA